MQPELEQDIHELNKCALCHSELQCPEYAFRLVMNPWQHPCMNKNIHHLIVLVSSLCNTCGGVIFLTTERNQGVPSQYVQLFKDRLVKLIHNRFGNITSRMINFIEAPSCLGQKKSWTAIHVKRCAVSLSLDQDYDTNLSKFYINVNGFVQIWKRPEYQHVKEDTSLVASRQKIPGSADLATESDFSRPAAEKRSYLLEKSPLSSAHATKAALNFSSVPKLDWSKNKKDWESYVHGETPTTETVVNSCSLWKPTTPMTVTPDKDTLKRWFASTEHMEKTLATVDTREPGFAVVCKTWKSHILNTDGALRPPGHICDIVTVSNNGTIRLWVICSEDDAHNIPSQLEYLLITGRMMKYQLVTAAEYTDLSNLCIECRLLCPKTLVQRSNAVSSIITESLEMQSNIWNICSDGVKFETMQRALAVIILSKDSSLKRSIAKQTAKTLSEQQVEVLYNNHRVNYVTGEVGSGKSYTAALLCQMYGRDNGVYICTTNSLLKSLEFAGYKGILVRRDQDLLKEIKRGTFGRKQCIIIDDSHNFTCTKSSMKKLFKLLRDNRQMSLYVFADNDYQSFDIKRKQTMKNCIRELSMHVLGKEPHYAYLTGIYRNTKKVVSFVQSVIQDSFQDSGKIECQNLETGEGIECIKMTNIWIDGRENELVKYIHHISMAETYKLTEIAVLLDPSYTTDQTDECRSILRKHIPDREVQSAEVFPRKGVVVDSVTSFLGLDAPLCVFILPGQKIKSSFLQRLLKRGVTEPDASICNPRFKVFMASRATHKAVFVVPKIDAEIAKELKFDLFHVGVKIKRCIN